MIYKIYGFNAKLIYIYSLSIRSILVKEYYNIISKTILTYKYT